MLLCVLFGIVFQVVVNCFGFIMRFVMILLLLVIFVELLVIVFVGLYGILVMIVMWLELFGFQMSCDSWGMILVVFVLILMLNFQEVVMMIWVGVVGLLFLVRVIWVLFMICLIVVEFLKLRGDGVLVIVVFCGEKIVKVIVVDVVIVMSLEVYLNICVCCCFGVGGVCRM